MLTLECEVIVYHALLRVGCASVFGLAGIDFISPSFLYGLFLLFVYALVVRCVYSLVVLVYASSMAYKLSSFCNVLHHRVKSWVMLFYMVV